MGRISAAPGLQARLEGERFIVEPRLGDRAGVLGAIALARQLAGRPGASRFRPSA